MPISPQWRDLQHLPLPDASVDGVAAINCLYFLDDPIAGIAEARRVLRPGGWFVASSPSRRNDPELEDIDPNWGATSTFDSEDAPALVAQVFDEIEIEPWSVVAYVLPDRRRSPTTSTQRTSRTGTEQARRYRRTAEHHQSRRPSVGPALAPT